MECGEEGSAICTGKVLELQVYDIVKCEDQTTGIWTPGNEVRKTMNGEVACAVSGGG